MERRRNKSARLGAMLCLAIHLILQLPDGEDGARGVGRQRVGEVQIPWEMEEELQGGRAGQGSKLSQ
ncbi:hypothetical protein PBY51_003439 [Eleginops maclovinus]|uniref:Uncharacterized protein n=1 Tax=Eleginops maclovinus TaxID=56733 RepID=A0AAN7Y322_ELEMC|nr:hypothetical protein PBY51_003439 [Eleginops maclovinus]